MEQKLDNYWTSEEDQVIWQCFSQETQ